MKKLINQQGFLSIIAVLMIIITGLIGTAVAYIVVSNTTSHGYFTQSERTFYIAEAGLEKAVRFLLTPNLTGANLRIACSALSGNGNLTNSAFSSGTFTVATVGGSPFYANSTLASGITSSATSLTAANAASFAAFGQVIIDNEKIGYSAVSGNTLVGLTRGMDNTTPSSHAASASISQYQCSLDSQAGIPSLAAFSYKRELQAGVQLQEAWAVGVRSTNLFSLTHWNRPTELQWTNGSFTDTTNREDLNGVSLLSNSDGWAVGAARSSGVTFNFTMLRLSGSGWTASPVSNACSGQHLMSVSAVSSQEAWAVGNRYPVNCLGIVNRYTVMRWNGSTWSLLAPPSIPSDSSTASVQNLNSVSVIDTDGDGIGNVGAAVGNAGVVLTYNGSQWSLSTPTGQNLNAVFVVSAQEAWAVGNSGVILKWNGSTWSSFASPTGTQLNGISMLDTDGDGLANTGWIVGNGGVALQYNGSAWVSQNIGGGTNFQDVAVLTPDDVWAVGNGGNIRHWNGSAWATVASGVTVQLNSIAAVAAKTMPMSGWREVYP